jgi:hypothetical protein
MAPQDLCHIRPRREERFIRTRSSNINTAIRSARQRTGASPEVMQMRGHWR